LDYSPLFLIEFLIFGASGRLLSQHSAPVLVAQRLDQPFKILVDASCIGAGAVVPQAD